MSIAFRRNWWLLIVLLLISVGMRARLGGAPTVPLLQPFDNFPNHVAQWNLVGQPALSADVLKVLDADDYMIRDYAQPNGEQAQIFVAYYRSQRAGEAMHSPKNCLPGSGWEPILADTVPLKSGPPGAVANRYVVEKEGDRALVLYWFQAQKRIIASEYWGKIYLVWDAIRDGRRDGAIVRVLVPMNPGESVATATRQALSFANPSLPILRHFLPS